MSKMTTIRVGYDVNGFQQRFGGVSRYFCEMIRRLPGDIRWELPFVETHNAYLTQAPYFKRPSRMFLGKFLPEVSLRFRIPLYKAYKAAALLSFGLLPSEEVANFRHVRKMVDSGMFDLIHFTGPHWLGKDWRYAVGRIPYVVTIHDLIPELFDEQPEAVAERGEVLENAAHVIAVSERTKADIVRLYGTPEEKITVIYHGRTCNEDVQVCPVAGIAPHTYLLFVGMRCSYKNWSYFVRAVSEVLISRNLTLVCVGAPFNAEEKGILEDCHVGDLVRCIACRDDELAWLYRNAIAFVYPSKCEGFGLPILEAFARRCPVALSRCSCFPEIAGDAALYFDDGNDVELRTQVESVLDGSVREGLVQRGIRRCADFSWECCAAQTAEVYRKVKEGIS